MSQANVFLDASKRLEIIARQRSEILVSFSGGKDSFVVLDLCRKCFPEVVCFFMYFIPGLTHIEAQLKFAEDRYKVPILQYPHWVLPTSLKQAIYRNYDYKLEQLPDLKLYDVYDLVMFDTGIPLIATGVKKADSMWRRRNLTSLEKGEKKEMVLNPIAEWNKFDVLAYLEVNKIPLPPSSGRSATGVDLSTPSLLWLYDTYPADFEKLLTFFPFAEAVVKRREIYGIKE